MWFKVFVLLRIPISAGCMWGYGTGLYILAGPGGFGGVVILGLFCFLAFTSIKLVQLRPQALNLAWLLLLLELLGAVLLTAGGDYVQTGVFNPLTAAGDAAVVGVLWALPNAILFYRWRGLFAEPAKEKPGDEPGFSCL